MLTGRKLLLADDSLTIQKLVGLSFGDEGCVVTCVGDGTSALEKLEEVEPDVVLADVFMPGLNGYELCERIKQHERFKNVPVVLLVGTFEPYNEEEARRVGANDVLTKPFQSIRELVGRVGDLFGGKSEPPPAVIAQSEIADAYADPIMDDEMIEATPVNEPAAASHEATMYAVNFAPERSSEMASNNVAMHSDEEHFVSHAAAPEAHEEQIFGYDTSQIPHHDMEARDVETHKPTTEEVAAPQDPVLEIPTFEVSMSETPAPEPAASETFVHAVEMPAPEPATHAQAELWEDGVLELDAESFANEADDDFALELDDEPAVVATPDVEPSHGFGHTAAVIGAGIVAGAGAVAALMLSRHDETVSDSDAEQSAHATPQIESRTPDMKSSEMQSVATPEVKASEIAHAQTNVVAQTNASEVSASNLSPELIETVARRVVELMSSKIVEEIAWEVVPQLSELMIKRKLEDGKL